MTSRLARFGSGFSATIQGPRTWDEGERRAEKTLRQYQPGTWAREARKRNGVGRPAAHIGSAFCTAHVDRMYQKWLAANIDRLRKVNPERFA